MVFQFLETEEKKCHDFVQPDSALTAGFHEKGRRFPS